jgi:hypothetical protein
MLRLIQVLAKKQGLTVEKYAETVISFEDATATERSTADERLATMDALRSVAESDPDGLLPSRDIVTQVGLRQCRADRAFVGYHVKQFRLAHQQRAAA